MMMLVAFAVALDLDAGRLVDRTIPPAHADVQGAVSGGA